MSNLESLLAQAAAALAGEDVTLIARGAMSDVAGSGRPPRVAHRFFHVPASNTAVGHLILENQA